MTDQDLRRAAKLVRGLQEDVERLKAARDEEGEVRFFRLVEDDTTTGDAVAVGPDADVEDGTASDDTVATSTTQASPGSWDSDDWDGSLEWG